MMFSLLSENDRKMMEYYIANYATDGSRRAPAELKHLLRFWEDAKSDYLFRMFGEQLMVSKDVVIQQDVEEIEYAIDKAIFGWGAPSREFTGAYDQIIAKYDRVPYYYMASELSPAEQKMQNTYSGLCALCSARMLATNVFSGKSFDLDLPDGKVLRVNTGCKVSKMLGKIAKAFDLPGYEAFRLAHSLCLNEKMIKGKLTLSLHPMDYMTMSDNESDWDSCMSWINGGEYRRGTVEMMNSPMVVVAYLESSNELNLGPHKWNSKKWRELFIVTPAVIAGIKGYPYWNRDIERQTIMMLRELAQKNLNWGPYNCEPQKFKPRRECEFQEFNKTVTFQFYTDAMYNDFYGDHYAVISYNCPEHCDVSYSGASECMCCGNQHCEFDSEYSLYCYDCDDTYRCAECGDRVSREYAYEVDGDFLCSYCMENLGRCEICGEPHFDGNFTDLYLANDKGIIGGSLALCYDCSQYPDHKYFKREDVKTYSHDWSHYHYIHYKDVSDKLIDMFGFEREDLDEYDGYYRVRFEENNESERDPS